VCKLVQLPKVPSLQSIIFLQEMKRDAKKMKRDAWTLPITLKPF